MKKIYFFYLILFLLAEPGISQPYLLKSEIMPVENNRDSRFSVQATVMQNDTWCKVNWPDPIGATFLEFVPDDGDADDYTLWYSPGNMSANKFHPYGYPSIVTGGRIYVGDGSFPGPFLGSSFRVLVYDDDGEDGLPGTALDSMDVIVNNYEWVEFEGMTPVITGGDFYLAMKQLLPAFNAAPLGVDTDLPTYFISYVHLVGAPDWVLSSYQDFMIRAWVEGYNEPQREIDYFQVARFSDFDPDGSPLLGDTTSLSDTIFASEYDDYAWDTLPAGLYAYGVKTHFTGGEWSDYDVSNVVTHIMNCFMPSCFHQAEDIEMPLIVCPPLDSTGLIPFNFIGYNVYCNSLWLGFLPPETISFHPLQFFPDGMEPGIYPFGISACYDLSPFGYPGDTAESVALSTDYHRRFGYPLYFYENWNYGSFGAHFWQTDGPNWSINGQEGNPAPTAEFTWDPILSNYESNLTSYPLLADSLTEGRIYLDCLIGLNSVVPTGTEFMLIQVWNWENQVWNSVDTISNADGSFDWTSRHIDITSLAMGQVFRIRFSAQGENSLNILSWFVDNIHVYRACNPPQHLEIDWNFYHVIELNWEFPGGGPVDQWIHWDDGVNNDNSIGGPLEFSVAARWEPDQLDDYGSATLTQIAFFPGEELATYNVRVWTGADGANLIVDQPVPTPIAGQWNTITLTTPVPIDITQELWVGYYVNTPTGYPVGMDDGPAIDGYGNMIYFGQWQTLLEINPDLDYNWIIEAFIEQSPSDSIVKYAIYRSDNSQPYFLRDYSDQNYYMDDSICIIPGSLHMYKVSALSINGNDTCESDYSNVATEVCEGISDNSDGSFINIYPNPCNDLLKIESSEELGLISLYNAFGKLILKKKVDDKQFEIPVAAYPAGVYMIRVEAGKEVVSRKVMVVH